MAIGGSNLGLGLAFNLYGNVEAQANKMGGAITNMQSKSAKAAASIEASMNRITSSFFAAGAGIAALISPFVISVKKAAEFEAQMSDVGAKSQATAAQLGALREQALALSSAQETANFTARQVAEGQSFLAMAGFSTSEIMGSLRGTLMLAAAGTVDLGRAADIASNTLAQFGLRANEMDRVADVIANAAVNSNQSVEQFADGMKFFGPTARALKISLEEAAGAMMILANSGLQGSLGTRALGTSLASRLTNPSKPARLAMKNLGFAAFDTTGKFVGMSDMIRNLDKALEGLSDKQRQAAIATIFGGESIQEINTLLSQEVEIIKDGQKVILKGADALDHFTKSNENAAGIAAKIARQKLDNLKGDITVLMSNIETALIKIGAALIPFIRPIVQGLSKVVSTIVSLLDTDVGKWTAIVTAGIAGVTSVMIALNFVVNTLGKSLLSMARVALVAAAPFLPYIIALGAIAGAVFFVNKSLDEFNKLIETGEKKKGFLGFMQKVGGVVKGVIEIFKTWDGKTFSLSKSIRDSLQKIGVLDFFLTLSTWVVRIIEYFKGFASVFKLIFSFIGIMLDKAARTFSGFFDAIGIDIDKAVDSLKSWRKAGALMATLLAGSLALAMTVIIVKMTLLAASVIAATWPILLIIAAIGAVIYAILNWEKVTAFFVEIWDKSITWVQEKFEDFTKWLTSLPTYYLKIGKSIGASIADGIATAITKLKGFGASILKTILGDDLGAKAAAALGLSSETMTGMPPAGNGTITPMRSSAANSVFEGAETIADSRGITARPEVVSSVQRMEVLKEIKNQIILDGDVVAEAVNTREELDLSRQ